MADMDGGDIVGPSGGTGVARLATMALPVARIGKRSFEARVAIVQTRHVTYQQKQRVFGNISPTMGGMRHGNGVIFGGGGTIQSANESVVQVVHRDFDGREETEELPASISAREGAILRLNFLNKKHVFAAQNLSGKQDIRILMGPENFIPKPAWGVFKTILSVIAVICALQFYWGAAFIIGAYPAITAMRRSIATKERNALGRYMSEALSMEPS